MMEKKLILYGAGMVGKQIGISLFFRKISIECFCDRIMKNVERIFVVYQSDHLMR